MLDLSYGQSVLIYASIQKREVQTAHLWVCSESTNLNLSSCDSAVGVYDYGQERF